MKKLFLFLSASAMLFGCSQDTEHNSESKKIEPKTVDESARVTNPCALFYTAGVNYVNATTAAFTWDTGEAVYCGNTNVNLEVVPFTNCLASPPTGAQPTVVYPITNFFTSPTGTVNITQAALGGLKCFNWRLVISGRCEDNSRCNTTTAWSYYSF